MLFTIAGLHAPVILLSEVLGNIGATVPLQREVGNEKVGVTVLLTVRTNVAIESQPAEF